MDRILEAVSGACEGVEGLQAAIVFGSVLERRDPGDLDLAFLWAEFAGPGWRASTLAYAERLAREPRLYVTWCTSPPLGVAVRT